jgi:hypothetical protein
MVGDSSHSKGQSPVASSTGGGLGSIAGGAELKLTGSGFNGDTEVLIGSRPCEITEVTDSSALTCVSKPMKQVTATVVKPWAAELEGRMFQQGLHP